MKKKTQEFKQEKDGARYAVCPLCGQTVHYPEGIYLRDGREVHTKCVQIARKAQQ